MTSQLPPHRFRRQAVSPDEAIRLILENIEPLGTETVGLNEAWARRSARPLAAPHPFPPYRRSAMDGYAVRAADLPAQASDAPVTLEVLESLQAGSVANKIVGQGQASRIMTGAMMPDGADTVVMLEMTETVDLDGRAYVQVGKPVAKGRNVADIGDELREGEPLFQPGVCIGAGEIALAAAFGFARLEVVRRPRVGVLSTGSELLGVDEPLVPGKIRNSNAAMLAALIREAGGEPVVLGHVEDDANQAEQLIRSGIAESDLMITTGGVSVGDSDVLVDILARWEGVTLFNKVAMRPGSPTTAARLDGKLLLGLSGNPGACFVGFHLFAVPALRQMQHEGKPDTRTFCARLAEDFPKINAYPRYIRARTEYRDGSVWVRPNGPDQSSLMKTIAEADSLLVVPPLKEGLRQGQLVTAISLRGGFFG